MRLMAWAGSVPARGARVRAAAAVLVAGATGACALEEVTLVEAEDLVVAEVYVQVGAEPSGESRATAWLHRTLGGGAPTSRPVPGADVLVTAEGGFSLELAPAPTEACVSALPLGAEGSCYAAAAAFAGRIRPGDALSVEIALPGGGMLRGRSTVPGDFALVTPPGEERCVVEPRNPLEVRWTRSAGAWAYLGETVVEGLRDALAPRGIRVEEDSLYLLGLSVSAEDTTIVFPGEFGVFDRFDLDQALAAELQKGLPEGTRARVVVSAVDRNHVNWIRGGTFNPSGQVRIPSLAGDGIGVFATSVSRRFEVASVAGSPAGMGPPCLR